MTLKRLTAPEEAGFSPAMALYQASFPVHEQRQHAAQVAALRCEDYHFDLICDGASFVGALLYWETPDFCYVEHFCIRPELRNRRYGQTALAMLGQRGKPVILEIDPPVDEIAVRRKGFYTRAGYCSNPYHHVHPPYRAEHGGHTLEVLSCPQALTQAEYDRFATYLHQVVMASVF